MCKQSWDLRFYPIGCNYKVEQNHGPPLVGLPKWFEHSTEAAHVQGGNYTSALDLCPSHPICFVFSDLTLMWGVSPIRI
jgi:hypothetical protein